MSTQGYIIDQIVNHDIDVIRTANNTAANASSELAAMFKRIQQMLKETPTSRLFRLSNDIEALMLNEMTAIANEIRADLTEFAPIEARFTEQMLVTATTIDTIGRTPQSILAVFTKAPMTNFIESGKVTKPTVDSLIKRLGVSSARTVRNIIRDASLQGRTARQISDDIKNVVINKNRNDIESTVLTSFNHYSNTAKQAVYHENSDIVDGMRIIATLDSKTTIICISLDGELLPLNSTKIPPYHYRCRSQVIPVIAKDLQLNIPGRSRASETGPVDVTLTYGGFLKRQSKERQDSILGPERAKLFRAGMSVTKFTNDRGVVLTLKQLAAMPPSKFN